MTQELPRASLHLQRLASLFPKFWRKFDELRAMRGAGLPEWPTWCYCPVAGAYAIVSGGGENHVPFERAHLVTELAALAAWRPTKGIYRFDEELAAALLETPVSGDLPREVLFRLPEWCVYVETPWLAPETHGFFVHLEWDAGDGRAELRMLLDQDQRLLPIILHLVDGTLEDAIRAFEAEAASQWAKAGSPAWLGPRSVAAELMPIARPLLSLMLYLCSDEADFGGRKPERPRPKKTKKGTRMASPDAPTVWDVGVRIGAALRAARGEERAESEGGTHASPRPHVRRAHWHTYWTGPKASQRPVVRWLSPMLVGVSKGETVATVHRVE